MSHEAKIHQAQTLILRELLFVPSANFAKLQKITSLESDHAKFHIKRLVELGYINKQNGGYSLSAKGKEYANKLDTDDNTIERQPKSSTIIIIKHPKTGKFLIQQRLKNPFFGFLSFFGGKIRWGETVPETAARETEEETGLITRPEDWQWRGVYHEIVRHNGSGEIVEDKLFYIMFTDKFSGELITDFEGGRNTWMSLDEVRSDPKHFHSFEIEASAADKNIGLVEKLDTYGDEDF
jgi:8-oxo-dGTP pyrophosphatase MutT (NUDIX family)